MEIHQLKTFVAVAREGSITRASKRRCLSQPAVSAHVKAIEDTLGITLFERTARGMTLTNDGQRILVKAERALDTHRDLTEEAARIKGRLTGKLRLGAEASSNSDAIGRLLRTLFERFPELEVTLRHGTSLDILNSIRNGDLDAGFYHETGEPDADLVTFEVSRFDIYVAARHGLFATSQPPDWRTLGEMPWIISSASFCSGQVAEGLFRAHGFRPRRITHVDRESVTRTLLAAGLGIGLLHAETAHEAQRCSEVDLLCEAQKSVRVLFAHSANRMQSPALGVVNSILHAGMSGERSFSYVVRRHALTRDDILVTA
ncbi:LysR family transcriptional regulator [Paraburkholderia megapolitana]|uniref:LysR family transcriptional regulator n=1 Tax=Paraburkholderia megapolitana TaxID=420953 RepID=UPI0038B734C8